MALPAPWVEFDRVRLEMQLTLDLTEWKVTKDGVVETIQKITDYGPVLHGVRSNGDEVTFSPACVLPN